MSSSVNEMKGLKYFERLGLDSFYFLASVPATVGGAVAMNAGLGVGPTVFDYVESLKYLDGDRTVECANADVVRSHRRTMFTGVQDKLILSVTFRFSVADDREGSIRQRVQWADEHQDIRFPNCGSVFREYHPRLLARFRGLPPGGITFPLFRAQYSRRVNNWIIARTKSSAPIVLLIRMVQIAHRLVGRRAVPEVIEVS